MKNYVVKVEGMGYSMFGFIMWTTRENARIYSLEEAERLVKQIPSFMGEGVIEEA